MYQAIIDGFLYKAAITNDYIMKRLVGVKKQLGDMGAVTRKHFSPELKTVATGSGAKDYILRPGSRRELAKHLSMLGDNAYEKRWVSLQTNALGKPRKGLLPEKQRLQNLLGLHHEKAELQAKRRFGYDLSRPDERRHASHLHPSVIERESRMAKRFGPDAFTKKFPRDRAREGPQAGVNMPELRKLISAVEKKYPPGTKGLNPWEGNSLEEAAFENRWYKAYDYYRNLPAQQWK